MVDFVLGQPIGGDTYHRDQNFVMTLMMVSAPREVAVARKTTTDYAMHGEFDCHDSCMHSERWLQAAQMKSRRVVTEASSKKPSRARLGLHLPKTASTVIRRTSSKRRWQAAVGRRQRQMVVVGWFPTWFSSRVTVPWLEAMKKTMNISVMFMLF